MNSSVNSNTENLTPIRENIFETKGFPNVVKLYLKNLLYIITIGLIVGVVNGFEILFALTPLIVISVVSFHYFLPSFANDFHNNFRNSETPNIIMVKAERVLVEFALVILLIFSIAEFLIHKIQNLNLIDVLRKIF